MQIRFLVFTVLQIFFLSARVEAQTLSTELVTLLENSIQEVQERGPVVWPPLDEETPFDILLLVGDNEYYLQDRQSPPADQFLLTTQKIAGRQVWMRDRSFPDNLIATFPVFDITPIIVIGTPEAINTTAEHWTALLFHEHFHQWQFSQDSYYEGVDALDLAGGDQTGMWMLNYPFPYEDMNINQAFDELFFAALQAYGNAGKGAYSGAAWEKQWAEEKLASYLRKKAAFLQNVGEKNARYMEFQLWQEGMTRYVESQFTQQQAGGTGENSGFPKETMIALTKGAFLKQERRVVFYGLGMLEGMILDRLYPDGQWKTRYFEHPYATTPLFSTPSP